MILNTWRQDWRALKRNPVYLREKGEWGQPNPFYEKLSRMSPFLVLGALIFGLCAGGTNPSLFAGNAGLTALWCFLCLPGALLSSVTMFGTLMAPALTAPSICQEMDRGSWEILRATPMSGKAIVYGKLFGALSRLRIWPLLLALGLLQGLIFVCGYSMSGIEQPLLGISAGTASAVRPWLEVLVAGLVGMIASTKVRSATVALASSYTAVLLLKLINSSFLWMGVFNLMQLEDGILLAGTVVPTLIYFLIAVGLWWALSHQAGELSYG